MKNIEALQPMIAKAQEMAMGYTPKIVLSVLVFVVGFWIVRRIIILIHKIFERQRLDKSLEGFLEHLVSVILKLLVIMASVSLLGVPTASFIALIGSVGLAIGLALQGSLSNFAGGVLIIFFKPFVIGDKITAQGFTGHVEYIQIFNTILRTNDNKRVIIPNGSMANGPIENLSAYNRLRVDIPFGIGYDSDINIAKTLLKNLAAKDERILNDPEPFVAVTNLGASSVDLVCRVWCKTKDYWGVHFDLLEQVKNAYDDAGISIPYPQQDVHVHHIN